MELPAIKIRFTITDNSGKKIHEGTFNFTDVGERRACSERFNKCLHDGYTVTTKRVK